MDTPTAVEEMTTGQIATELGRHRQTAWELLRAGKIKNARKVYSWLWVAPRQDVLDYKREQDGNQAA